MVFHLISKHEDIYFHFNQVVWASQAKVHFIFHSENKI